MSDIPKKYSVFLNIGFILRFLDGELFEVP